MNRLSSLLTALLAVQLLLCAAFFWPRANPGDDDARAPLLDVPATLDRLVISDADTTVLLSRTEAGWRLPEYHGLPADPARIERAVTELPALHRGWPVANSGSAAARFEVAEDDYQRRVEYFSNQSPAGTIYLGTSPGFRRVHARVADGDAIYAVPFNSFDVPADANGWLDKRLLQVADISAVTGLDYSLRRADGAWRGDDERIPDAAAVEDLVNGLESLRVTSAADIATASILEEMSAPPTLTVEAGGRRYAFRLYEIEDAYYIQRDDIPVFFSLSAFDYDRLNDVDAETLYPPTEEPGDADSAEAERDDNTGDTD